MKQAEKIASILPNDFIDDSDLFREYHNKLLYKYKITFVIDCDYWAMATGCIYDKDDKFIDHITGIRLVENGDWDGDMDGYLRLLEQVLIEKYKF